MTDKIQEEPRRGFLNRFNPFARKVEPVSTVSKHEGSKKGMTRRKFLQVAAITTAVAAANPGDIFAKTINGEGNNVITDPGKPAYGIDENPPFAPKKSEQPSTERKEQQITTAEVIGMPYASLTDGDKKLIDGTFDTTQTSYAGVLKQPKIEGTKFVGLPLESGSDAEKKVQQLVPLDYTMEKAGDLPEVHMAIDEKQGIVSSVVTNGDKPFQNGEKTFKQGTYFYLDDQGGTHYLELTDRPGGEEDKIMIIPVTDALRTDVGRFGYNGSPVKIADDAKYVLGQVSKNGEIVLLITKDFPLFFVRVEGSPQPTATPSSNTSTDLKPPVTPIPEQVLAKKVESVAIPAGAYVFSMTLNKDFHTYDLKGSQSSEVLPKGSNVDFIAKYNNSNEVYLIFNSGGSLSSVKSTDIDDTSTSILPTVIKIEALPTYNVDTGEFKMPEPPQYPGEGKVKFDKAGSMNLDGKEYKTKQTDLFGDKFEPGITKSSNGMKYVSGYFAGWSVMTVETKDNEKIEIPVYNVALPSGGEFKIIDAGSIREGSIFVSVGVSNGNAPLEKTDYLRFGGMVTAQVQPMGNYDESKLNSRQKLIVALLGDTIKNVNSSKIKGTVILSSGEIIPLPSGY